MEARSSLESPAHSPGLLKTPELQAPIESQGTSPSSSPVPGPSDGVTGKETAFQITEPNPEAEAQSPQQWEDIGVKTEKDIQRRSSESSSRSAGKRERKRQLHHKMKGLAWNQATSNKSMVNTFDKLQVLLLVHAQHDIALELEKFENGKKRSRKHLENQLDAYSKFSVVIS